MSNREDLERRLVQAASEYQTLRQRNREIIRRHTYEGLSRKHAQEAFHALLDFEDIAFALADNLQQALVRHTEG